jgi:hypothetical protein
VRLLWSLALHWRRGPGRSVYWPAAVAGAGFLAAHALIHLVLIASGQDHHAAADLALVVLPAALAVYSAFPKLGERYA